MESFVALLRGVNVSGHRIIKMAELINALEHPLLNHVSTYLQSGNILFKSPSKNNEKLESIIQKIIENTFGYHIEVKVLEKSVFRKHFSNNPFLKEDNLDTKKLYFIEIIGHIEHKQSSVLSEMNEKPEKVILDKDLIYVYYPNGYGRSRLNGSFFEKKLDCYVTARNFNTMKKLCELLENMG